MPYQWQALLSVRVDGIPKGQPRSRSRKGQRGVYDPGTAEGWKEDVVRAFMPSRPLSPIDEPLRIDIDFYFPRPRTLNPRVRAAYGGSSRDIPRGAVLFFAKPDRDNADKAVLDALTDMGYIRDDALAADGLLRRRYHGEGGRPGAQIRIMVWRKV